MMNKEITVDELAEVLMKVERVKRGPDMVYPYMYGTMIGLLEAARWGFKPVQQIVNERYAEAQKELAAA
jgi:hypothetical protein